MLLLTESTLFFVNLIRSASDANRRSEAVIKVNHWTTRVKQEHSNAKRSLHAPSITTATPVPLSTTASNLTQSTGATSVEDDECGVPIHKETYYGDFGEDGDDSQEHKEARSAGEPKQVSYSPQGLSDCVFTFSL